MALSKTGAAFILRKQKKVNLVLQALSKTFGMVRNVFGKLTDILKFWTSAAEI